MPTNKKILLVEDDKFLRDLFSKKLKSENYEVTESVDGESGLIKAKEINPNLILLDLILPGIDGFNVLKKLKEEVSLSQIPVIILSNLSQEEDIKKALALGAADFIIKANFTPSEIIEKIRKNLD